MGMAVDTLSAGKNYFSFVDTRVVPETTESTNTAPAATDKKSGPFLLCRDSAIHPASEGLSNTRGLRVWLIVRHATA